MNPADERLLQKAAAALTAHYFDKGVRDRLLAADSGSADDVTRAFALLDQAAAQVAAPAVKQDPDRWLAVVAPGEPGIERSVKVFAALAEDTGVPAEAWASTFALAASPESDPLRRDTGPAGVF